jgi:protein tyrosine kinase modulator
MNNDHAISYAPDLADYLAIMRRRKLHLIIPVVVIMFIALGAAFGLPPVYRSTATILIEQQEVPQDLVPSTVTSYAAERVEIISKRVLTRDNMWAIVEKFNLYPKERKLKEDPSEILSEMSKDINVEMDNADVVNPANGADARATIAFDLSYESHDPVAAQKVVSELVSLFLHENVKLRTEKAAVSTDFLAEEANRLNKHINETEAKLAKFKEKNVGRLPELMQLNMSLMERTEQQFEDVERQIASDKERKIYLESQLAQLQPYTGDSPEAQLRALQDQYLSASAVYAPDHPDIIRLKAQIEKLQAQLGAVDERSDLEKRIKQTEAELAAAREKYAEDHPDVVRLVRTLDSLQDALKTARSKAKGQGVIFTELKPDNPAYVSTRTQLESLNVELQAELDSRERLKKKLAMYEDRLTQMPSVEQEEVALRRDYDNTTRKYDEIKQKEMQAKVAEQLERESKGERFSLVEAPIVPIHPVKPNRLGIILLGTVLSMAGGAGVVSISEFLDESLRGSKAVMALLKAPPIAVIPYIKNRRDLRRARFRVLLTVTVILVVLAGILLTVHLFWMPLDVLLSTGLENIGWSHQ